MRVLTVARWYPSHDSPGRGSFVADLVRAITADGIDSRVVSFDRVLVRGPREERDRVLRDARAAYEPLTTPEALFVVPVPAGAEAAVGAPGVPVARLPLVRRPGTGDPAALIEDHLVAVRPFVRRLAQTWRPDVIHAHTGLPDGIVAAEIGCELGIPVIVTEHMSTIETELADPVALERYRTLLEPGVRLLGVSPSVAERVGALLGIGADRIGVLPNPVVDESFPLAGPESRHPGELLWVGSIGEHKGIDVLLEALARLVSTRPEVGLRIIGAERAGGERARLEALAETLGIGRAVRFDGWLPRDDVAQAMATAAAFVHPSPSETFGVAAAEAILSGLPVAARRSGGVPWLIELAGGFGRVADGDDPEAFAQAIEATLDGPFAVDAVAARERIVEAVGQRSVARQARAIYEAAIEDAATETAAPDARTIDTDALWPGGTPGPAAMPRFNGTPGARTRRTPLPGVLVATGYDQALTLVSALPAWLQRRLVLVVPPGAPAASTSAGPPPADLRIVEADAAPPPVPRPRGRGPIARIRRALWRPAPTAHDQFARAIVGAARQARSGGERVEIVAIDAPAAVAIAGLNVAWIRLAPGSLRWLDDRAQAEADPAPVQP